MIQRAFLILGLWVTFVPTVPAQQLLTRQEFRTGSEVYQAACIACHGADGRGSPQSVVGFDVPLPDFTDCLFATVEAAEGWEAVVHQGGPVRALDRHMPAFGEALTADEIRLVVAHVRTFCADWRRWPQGDLNFPRALITEKAFPENETVLNTSFLTGPAHAISTAIVHERRIGARTTVEFNVPFQSHQNAAGTWEYGLGDAAVAVKRNLFHSLDRGTIVSAGGEVVLPTGKEAQGLGNGFTTFEVAAALGQRLAGEGFVQLHGGIELPSRPERAAREAFWRVAIGRTFTEGGFHRTWTPIVEMVAAREIESGAAAEWDVVPQLQISLSKRRHILASAGVQIPFNQRQDRHPQVLSYVLWDFYEGSLFDGWR